jgi:toxin ParE1/3/4
MKKLIRRALADADVLTALDYCIANAPDYALALIDNVEEAYQHIQQFPASGSLRYAYELSLPDLRVWSCNKYPYLIFYVDYPTQIEVWRVLHGSSDIPATLQQET